MEKNHIKPHTLAKAANVPESSIKNILYGRSKKPSLELLEPLAEKLKCKISDLLSDDDPRINKTPHQYAPETWNGPLYVAALQAIIEISTTQNIPLTQDQAKSYAQRVYQYAIFNKTQIIDVGFAKYLMLNS